MDITPASRGGNYGNKYGFNKARVVEGISLSLATKIRISLNKTSYSMKIIYDDSFREKREFEF